MADIYEKADDNTLKVTTQKETKYSYDLLLRKKAQLEAELLTVNKLLAEAGNLGIVPVIAQKQS